MEQEITLWLSQNVSETIATAFSILCYILFFINNRKVGRTGNSLQTVVKEKVTYVDKENIKLTAEVVAVKKENASLKRRIERLETAFTSMIEEDTE